MYPIQTLTTRCNCMSLSPQASVAQKVGRKPQKICFLGRTHWSDIRPRRNHRGNVLSACWKSPNPSLNCSFPVLWYRQYFEDIKSVRSGLQEAPITISGPASAVIRGGSKVHMSEDSIIMISHDNIHLLGFTVNGIG